MEVLQAELKAQQANFDKQREAIIEDGISDLRKALRAEFALAKERDVAAALKRARVRAVFSVSPSFAVYRSELGTL
jgi:hypothetical protein